MIEKKLLEAIEEYCLVNEISDIASTVNEFLLTGFNIAKYGLSPVDNLKKESNEVKVVEQIVVSSDNEAVAIEPTVVKTKEKPKKSVRIIKNK